MSKTKSKTNKPTKKDLNIMHFISKIGAVSHATLNEYFKYHDKTVKRFNSLTHIRQVPEEETLENGKVVTRYMYVLTNEGKEYLLANGLNQHCCNYNGYKHNLAAEQKLIDLIENKGIQLKDIKGEAEQKYENEAMIELYKKEGLELSVVDFVYKDSNSVISAVEVETSNYRNPRRKAHANYVKNILGISAGNYEVVKY
ncbi:MAG: hypothetical protein ACRCX2_15575 [Paraclostridium sp.]